MTNSIRELYRERLVSLMKERLQVKHNENWDDDKRLNEDLRIDSVMIVQLIVYIETELHLSVPDNEVDPRAFSTIGTLLDFMDTLPPCEPAEMLE
ncbi:MAG: phosphopantetheine attachment site family protein [Paenibacillus sp.]|jgi:acyl carrier protein|nr:phosphopantetheine attachment site family protein [Paenibacillus sp.]